MALSVPVVRPRLPELLKTMFILNPVFFLFFCIWLRIYQINLSFTLISDINKVIDYCTRWVRVTYRVIGWPTSLSYLVTSYLVLMNRWHHKGGGASLARIQPRHDFPPMRLAEELQSHAVTSHVGVAYFDSLFRCGQLCSEWKDPWTSVGYTLCVYECVSGPCLPRDNLAFLLFFSLEFSSSGQGKKSRLRRLCARVLADVFQIGAAFLLIIIG